MLWLVNWHVHILCMKAVMPGSHRGRAWGESKHKNFPFDLFCFFGTYFFKIINSVVQLILLKKNSLASFHLRGEELGIFVHQLSTGWRVVSGRSESVILASLSPARHAREFPLGFALGSYSKLGVGESWRDMGEALSVSAINLL